MCKNPEIKYKFVCYKCQKVSRKGYLWRKDFDQERTKLWNKGRRIGRIPQELCELCYRIEKLKE